MSWVKPICVNAYYLALSGLGFVIYIGGAIFYHIYAGEGIILIRHRFVRLVFTEQFAESV